MADLTPITREETFLSAIANGTTPELTPITRQEMFLQKIIDSGGSGGGGEVTPASVATAIGNMNSTQKTNSRTALGAVGSGDLADYEQKPTATTVSGATPSIDPADNTIYKCGEITSLTIGSTAVSGDWTVIFTSGATPATFSAPSWMTMPDGFSIEANTRYEINVSDGYAVVASWEVSA